MSRVIPVTAADFEAEALQAKAPVLLVFTASWAGPCKAFMKTLEDYAAKNPALKVVSIDTDRDPDLCGSFSIRTVPTVVTMHGGKALFGATGNQPPKVLDQLVRESLAAANLPALDKLPIDFPKPEGEELASAKQISVMRPVKLRRQRKSLSFRNIFS
jgi:thioredoxin 1